jgi:hypothetical protein
MAPVLGACRAAATPLEPHRRLVCALDLAGRTIGECKAPAYTWSSHAGERTASSDAAVRSAP